MSEKEKEAKKVISKISKKYKEFLGLAEWDITLEYHNLPSAQFGEATGMETDVDISYLRATIKIFPVMDTQSPEDIKHTFVHELCHIITEPMYSLCRANVNPHLHPFVEEQREQETERIARIALKAFNTSPQ